MHDVATVTVNGSDMEVFVFGPPGSGGRAPAILLAQHLPGAHAGIETDPYTIETAERYAREGYVVAVPFLFHWWPKSEDVAVKREKFRDDLTVADLKATLDWLAGLPNVDPERVGIVGHCFGGRIAWLGAASDDRIKACVVFYGGRIKLPMGPGVPAIDLAPGIRCKVAGFFGNEDQNPSPQDVDDYDAALTAAGVGHEFHRYDGAGHAFQTHTSPERYRPEQSEDAWSKALAFLARELRPRG